MDLSALGSTLPPGLAEAEREMGDKFRASALSITTLYKSSLGYTKQAYQVGYRACLSDVLSAVQSSIGGGQDASQTLSRLMDWAEARETAMAAFAAEDDDSPSTSHLQAQAQPIPRRTGLARQSSHIHNTTSTRPIAAPLPDTHRTPLPAIPPSSDIDSAGAGPSRRRSSIYEDEIGSGLSEGMDPDKTYVDGSTPLHSPSADRPGSGVQMTPLSSPTTSTFIAGPSRLSTNNNGNGNGNGRKSSRSPLRYKHLPPNTTSLPPSSTSFSPSLPPNVLSIPPSAPSQGKGMKRPITTVHMHDTDITMLASSDNRGKGNKRRNLGLKADEDPGLGEKGERRRGRKGREGGGGAV